jgi:hypothetical protein
LSGQLGYVISSIITSSLILAINNSTSQTITSFTLPIGVWQCTYQVRYYNPTGTTTFTQLSTLIQITTSQNGIVNFAWVGNNVTQTVAQNTLIVSSTATIATTVSNTITLIDNSTYTGSTALNVFGGSQSYLMAVRIG